MRIAFLVPSLINRGPIIVVKDLVDAIINKIDKVVVFYLDDKPIELEFQCPVEKVSIYSIKTRLNNFDIVHSHMLRPDILLALMPGKRFRKISTLHNFMFDDLSSTNSRLVAAITEKIWILAVSRLDKITTLSNEMSLYYQKRNVNVDKLEVIYNGRPSVYPDYDIAEDDKAVFLSLKKKYFIIGVSAQLVKRKRVEQIIKAIKYLPEVAVTIIGDGPEKQNLEELSFNLGVSERCVFLGYRNNGFRYFKYFDAYCMCSSSEGFPLALLEAASFGLPTVLSDINIFKEFFTHREAAFFHLGDIHDMTKSIKILIKNKDSFSTNVKDKFLSNYTAEIMGGKYMDCYRKLLN